MVNKIIGKLCVIFFALILSNFLSYSYAQISMQSQRAQNPFGSAPIETNLPLFDNYSSYISLVVSGDFGHLPDGVTPVINIVISSTGASLVLLFIAFTISTTGGILIGVISVRNEPASVRSWLAPISSIGMALPAFFLATLFITAFITIAISQGEDARPFLPISGFGWDEHMILPLLTLIIRPIALLTQATSTLLSDELKKQYVTAARSFGASWKRIRRRDALKNVLAPIVLSAAGSFRLLIVELILVEYIFSWPGIGQLLAKILIPPLTTGLTGFSGEGVYFLHPQLLAVIVPIFVFLFLVIDLLASSLAQMIDPRLRITGLEEVASESR